MTVLRFDAVDMPRMTRTDEGYLRGEAPVTRTGVFRYLNSDGSVRLELRHPDDVLRTDSLDTIKSLPVVLNHPAKTADNPKQLVNSKNAKALTVGFTGDAYRVDSGFVVQPITITDSAAVNEVQGGKRGLSMGYELDCTEEAGNYNGQPYTHRQKNVRYNHLAIVDNARAGPAARMRLDAGDAVQLSNNEGETMDAAQQAQLDRITRMNSHRIDGIEYRGDAELINALTKAQAAIDAGKADVTKVTARADAAEGARDGALAQLAKHKEGEQARIDAAVSDRVKLLGDASLVLGTALNPAHNSRQMMEAVVRKGDAKVALDGVSDDYVRARFDMAVTEAREKVMSKNRGGNGKPGDTSTRGDGDPDPEAARAAYIKGLQTAYQPAAK